MPIGESLTPADSSISPCWLIIFERNPHLQTWNAAPRLGCFASVNCMTYGCKGNTMGITVRLREM
jgi:hypothetical protein